MAITIRTPNDGDFFDWLGLYEGYAQFYQQPLTDQRALQLWSWLTDAGHEENALVAVDDGSLVGLVHFREYTRPLEADRACYLDDLFVADAARRNGVGRAMIQAVRDRAAAAGLGAVQWITAADNADAQRLYDEVATRTQWVTYEIDLAK